jgi:hypothetical protein
MFENKDSGNEKGSNKENKKGRIILGSVISTVILFIIFAILQYCESPILELDSKWIFVSLVPLLLALIYTGAIKSFKGWGIELETNITDTVTDFDRADNVETVEVPKIEKLDFRQVINLSNQRKKQIERLKFTLGKQGYYTRQAINQYFMLLPNLKYIELTDSDGKFNYLIQADQFRSREESESNTNPNQVIKLISAIEERSVSENFSNAISLSVTNDKSLIETYRIMEKTNQGRYENDQILPVVNENGAMIGLVSRRKIEQSISKQVLEILSEN